MPVSAVGRVESPEQYVARIREETQGGYLIGLDGNGNQILYSGPLAWTDGLTPHELATKTRTELRINYTGTVQWLRLLAADGRDVGWRGNPKLKVADGSTLEGPISLVPGQYVYIDGATIYPPR